MGPGGTGNDVLVAAGAELDIQSSIALPNVEVSICGTGVGSSGALHSISGTNSLAGVVNLTGNLQAATDSGIMMLAGPIQGSYNLTKTGTGILSLAADSSSVFAGAISVLQGTLDIANAGALGNTSGGGITAISPSAALSIHGGISVPESLVVSGSGVGGSGVIHSTQGDNELFGSIQLTGNSQVAVDTDSLTLSGAIFGNAGITKTGSGTLSLTNWSNSFGGSVSVPAGTLNISSMNNAGSAGPLGSGTTGVNLSTSGGTATLEYSGFGDTSNRSLAIASGGTALVQIDYPTAVLTLTSSVSGSGTLVKSGYGILTVGGSASYSGPTYVTQGVLAINPGGSLINTSTISLSPGTILQLTNTGNTQLPDSAVISMQGSEIIFNSNGASSSSGEIVGNLALGPGENDIVAGLSTSGTNHPYLRFASTPASHTIGAGVVVSASGAASAVPVEPRRTRQRHPRRLRHL